MIVVIVAVVASGIVHGSWDLDRTGVQIAAVGTDGSRSGEAVTAVLRDHAGFLWLGTREGLYRYDGYGRIRFDHEVGDPDSISDNDIRTIYEDRSGRLWIGTNSGGLELLDRATWTFRHFRHQSDDPTSISHDSVYAILEDHLGQIWVGTQKGLNRLDLESGTFERIHVGPDDPQTPGHEYVYTIYQDEARILWFGTVGGGLDRYDPETGDFRRFRYDAGDPTSLGGDQVFEIAEDADGVLWIATENGLSRYDREGERFRVYRHDSEDPGSLSHSLVSAIAPGPPGTLWVATWGGGLNEFDTRLGIVRQRFGENEVGSIGIRRIVRLLAEADGSLWIGTWEHGLQTLRRVPGGMEVLRTVSEGEDVTVHDATSVRETSRGALWVGTWGDGVAIREPGEKRLRSPVEYAPGIPNDGSILTMFEDSDGSMWSGTMSALLKSGPTAGAARMFRHDPDDPASLGDGYVRAVLRDRDGTLWVGVGGGGLNRLRSDGRSFERLTHDSSDPTSLTEDYVTVLHQDREGTIWVGTRSGGLNAMDPANRTFRGYLPDPDDPTAISHHGVTSILEEPDGTVWIGTSGGGFNRLVRDGSGDVSFESHTEVDGLIDDNVMGLALDDDGSLWITTRRGLSRFDPESGAFVNYDADDGLPSSAFNPGAVAAGTGRLYFGTPAGVVSIRRGTSYPERLESPTVLTSIRSLAGTIPTDAPVWRLRNLEVPYGEVLSFEFAVLDFRDQARHRYSYRLEGMWDDWIDLGPRREITFTDLDPGTYTLTIRGRNGHGVWSAAEAPLTIRVVPPFWMTAWFRFLVAAGVIAAVIGGHRIRTAALERRNRELVALQDQRESALEDLRRSQDALNAAYGRLRRLTRRLEAAKEDERKRIARELHDEMGQALTAAKINLQLLSGAPDEDARAKRITDTVGLVDRMIHHVRALSLDLRPPLLDELGLSAALNAYLEAQSRRSGVRIDVDEDPLPTGLSPEVEITAFRAIQEAVTNVLRHAHARSIEVAVRAEPGWMGLIVRDDGDGFDVAEIMERAIRGNHLGLLGIRERVESLGGVVEIDSAPGDGTKIRVRVPLGA